MGCEQTAYVQLNQKKQINKRANVFERLSYQQSVVRFYRFGKNSVDRSSFLVRLTRRAFNRSANGEREETAKRLFRGHRIPASNAQRNREQSKTTTRALARYYGTGSERVNRFFADLSVDDRFVFEGTVQLVFSRSRSETYIHLRRRETQKAEGLVSLSG